VDGGLYKQHFVQGFKEGRMDKINHNNKQYNLNLKLMKDGSIRHGEQGVAEGLTEMDKSQTPPGRDGDPRPGPDKEAKPISKEKMVKHALDALSKSMAKKDDKKKDVKESDSLMMKLKRAMVREGRVKELADDLKTMADAEFMKKYGKAKAAIRADMKRVDEAGINRLVKKDFDFRTGLVGDDQTDYETQNEPELGMFRMGKPVEPNDAATKEFMAALTPSQQDNRFTAPAGWRYVEKDEDPARYGSGPAGAASALPNLIYDPQSRTLKSADTPALDLSPKSKYKFDRTTQSQVPADGSGANRNIDAATRDRARAYAAKQNAPATAAKQKMDWKTIYALNKATIGTNPNLIRPGMKLNMPDGSTYRVQPGDNLSKIAAKQSQINELSTEKLAQYKTAAAADAKKADQEGDFKRGDRRFSGIVKATKKQFDNDAKKVDESRAARRALMAQIVNHR
jgi:LysM repeat protein